MVPISKKFKSIYLRGKQTNFKFFMLAGTHKNSV